MLPDLLDFIAWASVDADEGDGEGDTAGESISSSSSERSGDLPRTSRIPVFFLELAGGDVVIIIGAPFVRVVLGEEIETGCVLVGVVGGVVFVDLDAGFFGDLWLGDIVGINGAGVPLNVSLGEDKQTLLGLFFFPSGPRRSISNSSFSFPTASCTSFSFSFKYFSRSFAPIDFRNFSRSDSGSSLRLFL